MRCAVAGLSKYVYGVACACMRDVDKYEGVRQIRACSRRIASASEVGEWGMWGGLWVLVWGGLWSFAMRLVISSITVICKIRKR